MANVADPLLVHIPKVWQKHFIFRMVLADNDSTSAAVVLAPHKSKFFGTDLAKKIGAHIPARPFQYF